MAGTNYTAFIGAGNVAWHLAPAFDNAGFPVREVFSRNPENAKKLARRLYEADVRKDLDFSESECELFIISISDDSLEEVVQEVILPEKAIVAHTSGTQPLSVLGYLAASGIGVFYPLQTFSKAKKVDLGAVPIFIEGEDPETVEYLENLASRFSRTVNRLSTADRKVLHLAAVFACNFTNHMFTISKNILENRGLEFEYLHPLITETINKSLDIGPENSQTGPAARSDFNLMQQQLSLLSDSELEEIYRVISEHIGRTYQNSE